MHPYRCHQCGETFQHKMEYMHHICYVPKTSGGNMKHHQSGFKEIRGEGDWEG